MIKQFFEAKDCKGRWTSLGVTLVRTDRDADIADVLLSMGLIAVATFAPLPRLARMIVLSGGILMAARTAIE